MKNNMIKMVFVAAIVLACGINVFKTQKSETLSEIALANVEALANATPIICKGFTYVCASEEASFIEEMKKNCDISEIGYAVLSDC